MSRGSGSSLPLWGAVGLCAIALGIFASLREAPGGPLRIGTPVPEFRLQDLEGRPTALSELRGRVLFVNFWGTWCPPCREEAPALERLHRALRGEGFAVLGVSIDDPGAEAEVVEFQREFSLSFPILRDPGKRVYAEFGASGVPETFLVDAEGRLVERFIGPRDWDDPRYARAVRRLLPTPPPAAPAQSPPGGTG